MTTLLTARQIRERNRERQRRFRERLREKAVRLLEVDRRLREAEAELRGIRADAIAWRLTGERMVRDGRMTQAEFDAILEGASNLSEVMTAQVAEGAEVPQV